MVMFLLLVGTASRTCTMRECEYLGQGYDIIGGDPHAASSDPGWKANIFSDAWVLANAEANDVNVCGFDSVTSTISGGKTAQAAYSKDWSFSGSVGIWVAKVAYTGSGSVNDMNKSSWEHSTHFEDARASCEIMFAMLPPPFVAYNFTTDFAASVGTLPNASSPASDAQLAAWMGYYGTHFSTGVTMGGQMVIRWTMTSSSFDALSKHAKETGHSIEAGAKGSFWIFSDPEAKLGHHSDKVATDAFQNATKGSTATELYIGGAPFVKGDPQQWYAGLKDALAPVAGPHSQLTAISDLLTPLNFPHLASRITGIKQTAEDLLQRLCTPGGSSLGYTACTASPVDPERPPPPPPSPACMLSIDGASYDISGFKDSTPSSGYFEVQDKQGHTYYFNACDKLDQVKCPHTAPNEIAAIQSWGPRQKMPPLSEDDCAALGDYTTRKCATDGDAVACHYVGGDGNRQVTFKYACGTSYNQPQAVDLAAPGTYLISFQGPAPWCP